MFIEKHGTKHETILVILKMKKADVTCKNQKEPMCKSTAFSRWKKKKIHVHTYKQKIIMFEYCKNNLLMNKGV